MTTLNRGLIISRFANFVVQHANSGINWGTNAAPFTDFPISLFGGTTAGIPFTQDENLINSGTPTSLDVYNKLIQQTQLYTRIRKITANRNVTGPGTDKAATGVGTGINFTATGIANMVSATGSILGNMSDPTNRYGVVNTNTVSESSIDALMVGLRDSYNAVARNNPQVITIDVCHASCHSSCHSSRGRR